MPTKLPPAVQRQLEETQVMDEEIAQALAPPTPPAPDAPPTPPAAEPPPAPAPTEENWQHKFLTLQGKYNTETAALRTQVAGLADEIKALKTATPPTPEPAPAAPAPATKLVTDADVDNFGADLVDLIRRAAREESEPERDRLLAEIQTLRDANSTLRKDVDRVDQSTTDTRQDTCIAELAKAVPDYVTINEDAAFLGWLSLADPISGIVRDVILKDAFGKFDHVRTAAIFNAFKQETGRATTPPTDPPPPPPPAEGLEAQVSPGASKTASVITPDDGKKTWTSAEVGEFYNAVTRGDYRGRVEDVRRIDAEIDKAFSEGRVQA